MRIVPLIFGIVAVLLGGLWLLQGVGAVHIRLNLCFAGCVPVQGHRPFGSSSELLRWLQGWS